MITDKELTGLKVDNGGGKHSKLFKKNLMCEFGLFGKLQCLHA